MLIPNLVQLSVHRLIIHEVPQHLRRDTESSPVFSEIESELDEDLRVFFREKIVESAGSSTAFGVLFDEDSPSPIPGLIGSFLSGNGGDFIGFSKEVAQHLHDKQGGVNPGGLVTIVDCRLETRKAVGILKLEKEKGVRLNQTTRQGKRTFDVNYIRDLILTKKTKLFKIGFFWTDPDGGDPAGAVCDDQRGYMPKTEIASFFLSDFLGCRLMDDPRVATKQFFIAAQEFFNQNLEDPAKRARAVNHLLSEVTSGRTQINIRAFANDYLPADKRQAFTEHIHSAGIRGASIRKNLELIEGQTEKMSIEFFNDVKVIAGREAFGETVKLQSLPNGEARVEVTGKLKQVKSK